MSSFQSLKWLRNVLDVMAAARIHSTGQGRPTFLAAAVATDMACFAGKNGLLFRSEEDQAKAVGASLSNIREARNWLRRAGLAEAIKVEKDTEGKNRKGRDATDFRLHMIGIQEAIYRLHTGGKSSSFSAPMQAVNDGAFTAPIQAALSACMQAPTVERTGKGAGARSRAAPAPTVAPVTSVVLIDTEDHIITDAHQKRAPEAVEPPLGASAADPCQIIAADIEPPETRPFAPVSEAEIELPGQVAEPDRGDDLVSPEPVTLDDLDRLDREKRAALEAPPLTSDEDLSWMTEGEPDYLQIALDELADFQPVRGMSVAEFAEAWALAFIDRGNPAFAERATSATRAAMSNRAGFLSDHLDALRAYAVASGYTESATDHAITAYRSAVLQAARGQEVFA